VKFMRYYLPLYPLLVISGTVAISMLLQKLPKLIIPLYTIIFLPTFMWLLAFMSIYTKPHPWIQASDWILTTIPSNETIATEHWDNVLPLYNSFNYSYETLELYIPDSENKINKLVDSLEKSNYIVIATNRLTDSIPRWPDRYPATIEYYNKLLNERLGFSLIAEFTSYPSILGYQINDQTADESFTVYDHPRVRVFQKNNFDVDEVRKNLLRALE
ncbi:hypothetical protein KC573_02690, partial [candidate division WWE3 bacterium]|nr:hypothetical protein [candidate division WWE3 bacterium]